MPVFEQQCYRPFYNANTTLVLLHQLKCSFCSSKSWSGNNTAAIKWDQGVSTRPTPGQYIFQIINRSISNENPLCPWTFPSSTMNRTTGKEEMDLLIKRTSLETRTKPLLAIFSCLITKWAFLKRQAVALSSLKWHLLSSSLSNVLVSTMTTATLLNLNLWLIHRLTRWL